MKLSWSQRVLMGCVWVTGAGTGGRQMAWWVQVGAGARLPASTLGLPCVMGTLLGLHLNSSPVLLGGKSSSYFLNREAYTVVKSKLVNTHLVLRKELGSQEALNKRSCYRHHVRGSCSQDVANASRFSILSTQKSFCTEKETPFLKEIIHSQENLSYSKLLKGLREHRAST